jgi:hypothetical protein
MIVTILIVVPTYVKVAASNNPIWKSDFRATKSFAYRMTRKDNNDNTCIHIYISLLLKISVFVPINVSITDTLYNNESISLRILVKEVARLVKQVIPRNTDSETSNCFVSLVPKEGVSNL